MHNHLQPSLHDGHDDGDRIQDWVTQQYLEPELNSFVKLGDGVQYSQLLERPDSPLEDFAWSSSAASSTPALNSVLVKDEDNVGDISAEGTEMDAHNTFDALMAKHQSLPPMTFKRGRLSDDDSSSSSGGCDESTDQHEQHPAMRTDKPLPPPPPPSPPHTTENTYVAPTRSRHPSIVSLTGYHLPSSVQISSTPSPRSSFVSLSRQSSLTGHSSAHGHSSTGVSHMRQSSLSRQPSLGLLSPSASSTLFEEDDRADLPITPITSEGDASSADSVMRERDHSHSNTLQIKAERRRSGKPIGLGVSGGCKPILKHARSDSKSDYRSVSGHARGLSRSTSGSGASLLSHSSSLRRQSSVNSIYSSNSGGSSGGNRVITRHASAGNLLSRPSHSTPHTHTHSPSLPCPPSLLPPHSLPIRRSVVSRLSTASATGSTHASIHFADDNGDAQTATSAPSTSALKHSPSTSMSLSLLAPPPTATFAPSSGMLGSSSGSATASTPRNRDAVYIDAVDSEEVQKRLAALLAASDPTNMIGDSQTAEAHMQDQGEEPSQEIDYYEDDKSGVYINPSQVESVERSVARNSRSEIAQPTQMTAVDEQVPEVEQSHWSPASTNSELPLSPATFSKHTSAYGLGIGTMGSVPGVGLGLVGAPPSSKRKSKAKKDKDDNNSRKRKSVSSGSKEVEEHVEEASGPSPDEGAPKRPGQRQRLASFIARAIGANGFNGSSTITLNASVASESSVETSDTSSPTHTVSDPDLESSKRSASPTVSIPSQRVRALSNANKPSPLRIEVTPFSQSSSSTVTSPGPSTASTARPRAISLTPNPTPPLSPSKTSFFGRMRSGSQVSSISQKTTSTTFSTTTTSTTSSTSSAGFGSVLDKFPSPGDEEDHRWEVRASVLPEEDEEDTRKSEDSEPEDDGAYYVMAFSKNYGKGKRSSKSPVREKQDDGDATETEAEDSVSKNFVEDLPPLPRHPRSVQDSESRPSSQIHIQTVFRPTSVAKSSLFVPLPLSPPPSLSPSPILPVNSLRMPSPSNDLLDSDPFAATSSPAATVASTPGNGSPAVTPGNSSPASYFNNHPSPFGAKTAATGHHYPYSSRALQASKSMSTLPRSAAAAIAADVANGAKSLISPGDLPPSKVWKNFDVQQEHVVSPPMSPTFGLGSKPYNLPPSPGSSPVSPVKKSTKSKLRMSVSGLVSRLYLGGSSQHPSSRRESPTTVPLPPPTPGEDFTMHMLPTPSMTPTVPSAPTPPLLPSHFPPSEFIDDEGDYDDDDDYDTDVVTPPFSPTTSSPPTPSLYGEPVLKRKSLGLGLGSGEDGTVGSSRLSLSSITSRSKKAKKRRLVISGVAVDDEQAYEAVKEWCRTFGQIRQITRKPNGNLHVDFRSASVAETVCRVQATVNIKGAGSVALSWYTGKDKGRDGVDLRI